MIGQRTSVSSGTVAFTVSAGQPKFAVVSPGLQVDKVKRIGPEQFFAEMDSPRVQHSMESGNHHNPITLAVSLAGRESDPSCSNLGQYGR